MKTSKDNSEYGNFLDLVDAAVRTPHDEIKAELDAEKTVKKSKKHPTRRSKNDATKQSEG